jgi:hypothetical protein
VSAPAVGGSFLALTRQNHLIYRIAPPLTRFAALALTLRFLMAGFFLFDFDFGAMISNSSRAQESN